MISIDEKYLKKKYAKITKSYEIIRSYRINRHSKKNSFIVAQKGITNFFKYQFLSHYGARPPLWRLLIRGLYGERPVPKFALIGPIKSGTSDLVTNLLLHPSIIPPLAKEIFSMDPMHWAKFYPTVKELDKVKYMFGNSTTGFLGPFMHSVQLIEQYSRYQPNAKIIIILRDPVLRAYSHWKWDWFLAADYVSKLSYYETFEKYVNYALDLFPEIKLESKFGFPILETGIYCKAVELWIRYFGRDNILVLNSESYFSKREDVIYQIQEFIGIEKFDCKLKNRVLNPNPLSLEPIDEHSISRLIEFYKPYNQKLFNLIGKSFDWH